MRDVGSFQRNMITILHFILLDFLVQIDHRLVLDPLSVEKPVVREAPFVERVSDHDLVNAGPVKIGIIGRRRFL